MVRLETGYRPPSEVAKENRPSPDIQKNPPHGVDPKTYDFLLAAVDYNRNVKNIFDAIDPTTRNLIGVYFGAEVSLTEVATFAPLSRNPAKNRILRGLKTIWEQLPSNIQKTFPKEEIIKVKDPTTILRITHTKIAKTLWKNPDYRKKTTAGIQEKSQDPNFIRRMKDVSRGRPSPMKGKKHTEETVGKIREGVQRAWNERRNADLLKRRAHEFSAYLQDISNKLLRYGISEEDVKQHCSHIQNLCDSVSQVTSLERLQETTQRLDLYIIRVIRKIGIITSFQITYTRRGFNMYDAYRSS